MEKHRRGDDGVGGHSSTVLVHGDRSGSEQRNCVREGMQCARDGDLAPDTPRGRAEQSGNVGGVAGLSVVTVLRSYELGAHGALVGVLSEGCHHGLRPAIGGGGG
jgi:hypothetical protein